jgi:hypothetical protein
MNRNEKIHLTWLISRTVFGFVLNYYLNLNIVSIKFAYCLELDSIEIISDDCEDDTGSMSKYVTFSQVDSDLPSESFSSSSQTTLNTNNSNANKTEFYFFKDIMSLPIESWLLK